MNKKYLILLTFLSFNLFSMENINLKNAEDKQIINSVDFTKVLPDEIMMQILNLILFDYFNYANNNRLSLYDKYKNINAINSRIRKLALICIGKNSLLLDIVKLNISEEDKIKDLKFIMFKFKKVDQYLNYEDENGYNVLLLAVEKSLYQVISLLISKNVDVNRKNIKGITPLIKAVEKAEKNDTKIKIVELLLKNNANVNLVDLSSNSALMKAVERNNLKVTKLLLDKDADCSIINSNNLSVLDIARRNNNSRILQLIQESIVEAHHKDKKIKTQ